jgi:hypothetical protein
MKVKLNKNMRFTKEKEMINNYWTNKTKLKRKFLWLPINIDGETRWLETATIEYRVDYKEDLFCNRYYFWKPINFIDNE